MNTNNFTRKWKPTFRTSRWISTVKKWAEFWDTKNVNKSQVVNTYFKKILKALTKNLFFVLITFKGGLFVVNFTLRMWWWLINFENFQIWACLSIFEHIWAIFVKLEHVWASLNKREFECQPNHQKERSFAKFIRILDCKSPTTI